MNPGGIGRDGYLVSVLSIAVSGYLGQLSEGYPTGAAIAGQAGTVTSSVSAPEIPSGAVIAGQAGSVTVDILWGDVPTTGSSISCLAGSVTIDIGLPQGPTTHRHSGLNICARSGMKAKPGQLVMDPYTGQMVLPKYLDEPQPEPEQSKRDRTRGPTRPEQDDRFITTPVDKDDL